MTDRRDDARGERRPNFDPEEFDFPASALEAKAQADTAHLAEQLTLILGSHQEMKGLVRRLETLLADRALKDAERDAALAGRLITASDLSNAAQGGARVGAESAGATAAHRLDQATKLVESVNRRISDEAKQRDGERARWVQAAIYFAIGVVVVIVIIGALSFVQGVQAGEARGYARARNEVAATSWVNTIDGRFAQKLNQAGVISQMRTCTGAGWTAQTVKGRRACFGGASSFGWYLP